MGKIKEQGKTERVKLFESMGIPPAGKFGTLTKDVEFEVFELLCRAHCNEEEIASWFGVTRHTINTKCKEHYDKTFQEVNKEFKRRGKADVKIKQYKTASVKENPVMLKWLGEHWLGQKPNVNLGLDGDIEVTLKLPEGIQSDKI